MAKSDDRIVRCSFCGKRQEQVKRMMRSRAKRRDDKIAATHSPHAERMAV